MLKHAVASFAVAVAALSVSPATAEQDPGVYRSVERGHTVRVIGFFEIDPNCRSEGRTSVNLLTAPQGGRLEVEYGSVFPNFPTTNVRSVCNKRRVPATNIYYTASPNFSGEDSFTVEKIYPGGIARQSLYTVHVR